MNKISIFLVLAFQMGFVVFESKAVCCHQKNTNYYAWIPEDMAVADFYQGHPYAKCENNANWEAADNGYCCVAAHNSGYTNRFHAEEGCNIDTYTSKTDNCPNLGGGALDPCSPPYCKFAPGDETHKPYHEAAGSCYVNDDIKYYPISTT